MRKDLKNLWLSESNPLSFGEIIAAMGIEPDDPLDVVCEKCESAFIDHELTYTDRDVDRLSELLYAHSDVIVDSDSEQLETLFEGHEIEMAFQDIFSEARPAEYRDSQLTNRESVKKIYDILG